MLCPCTNPYTRRVEPPDASLRDRLRRAWVVGAMPVWAACAGAPPLAHVAGPPRPASTAADACAALAREVATAREALDDAQQRVADAQHVRWADGHAGACAATTNGAWAFVVDDVQIASHSDMHGETELTVNDARVRLAVLYRALDGTQTMRGDALVWEVEYENDDPPADLTLDAEPTADALVVRAARPVPPRVSAPASARWRVQPAGLARDTPP